MPIPRGRQGVAMEMGKFGAGQLHAGSPTGPVVTDPAQAKAIAMRMAGMPRKPMAKPKRRKKFTSAAEVDAAANMPRRRVML